MLMGQTDESSHWVGSYRTWDAKQVRSADR